MPIIDVASLRYMADANTISWAPWIAIGLSALAWVVTTAVLWGKQTERIDFMKGEIINLQNEAQTPGEREALGEVLEIKFATHERLDDLRFDNLSKMIDSKLDKIIAAVSGK